MRPAVHTRNVAFRASNTLVAEAETIASKVGMSMPEFMRAALRDAVRNGAGGVPSIAQIASS